MASIVTGAHRPIAHITECRRVCPPKIQVSSFVFVALDVTTLGVNWDEAMMTAM